MTSPTNWTDDLRVPALLEDIRNVPPGVRWFEVPSRSALFARDRVWEYVHPAIDALKAIQNEHFLKLDVIDSEQGAEAYMAVAGAFLDEQPSVADLVEAAMAEADQRLAA